MYCKKRPRQVGFSRSACYGHLSNFFLFFGGIKVTNFNQTLTNPTRVFTSYGHSDIVLFEGPITIALGETSLKKRNN